MTEYTKAQIDEARALLSKAGLFYWNEGEEVDSESTAEEQKRDAQTLNQNDVWAWAYARGEYVPDEELPILARLFKSYGRCGVLYWVSRRNENMRSEFRDNQRFVDFVANEERIRAEVPDYNRRAYAKRTYTIGSSRARGLDGVDYGE